MKKCIAIILMFIMLMLSMNVSAVDLTAEELKELDALEILEGDENGELRLSDKLTIIEAMKMLTSCFGIRNYYEHEIVHSEYALLPVEHWAHIYVYEAFNIGLVPIMTKEEFNPDSSVSGEDALKMIMKVAGYEYKYDKMELSFDEILDYAIGYGIVIDSFKADEAVTREEFASMIVKMFDAPRMCLEKYDSSHKATYFVLDGKDGRPFSTYRTFYVNNHLAVAEVKGVIFTKSDVQYLKLLLNDLTITDEEAIEKIEEILKAEIAFEKIDEAEFYDFAMKYYDSVEKDETAMKYLKSIGCNHINNFKADTQEILTVLYGAKIVQ